ncbi:hypothetical protein GGP74_001894 [Salinibacter ruber]|nr:hypothetical protein [Salinibacter ruber]MCS4059820.1 hypothetical protein [Salinibacter ruber]
MDFQLPVDEVDDPVFWKVVPGVESPFPRAVELERGVGHLDDKDGRRRMVVEEVAGLPFNHRHIGLWLRVRAEGQGQLLVD